MTKVETTANEAITACVAKLARKVRFSGEDNRISIHGVHIPSCYDPFLDVKAPKCL